MDLLTQREYQAIAADMILPTNAYINGSYRAAISGDTCLFYASPSPRDRTRTRLPSSA